MKKKEEEINIIEDIFRINKEITLTKDEETELLEWKDALFDLIAENGTEDINKIKEIVLDDLLENNQNNIIDYLGLKIDETIITSLETKLNSENFKKIEESENNDDFFSKYLQDDLINDLIYSLLGYERKAEGVKEIFIKKRGCKIPSEQIIAIGDILKSFFNKIAFLSEKEDIEQAHIILHTYDQVFDILLEIPYTLCDTRKTIEILGMVSVKLTNAIGLSKDFRKGLLETIRESYKSMQEKKDKLKEMSED